jgi:hypothetical protein
MDENMSGKMTVLEEIMSDVAKALFQRWANGLPEDQRGEEALAVLNKNATEATYFIIQMFMNRFNEAAEELKNKSE